MTEYPDDGKESPVKDTGSWFLPVSPQVVTLLLAVVAALVVFNITNIYGDNWFKHPDEAGTYLLGKRFLENGDLTYLSTLNETYDTEAFTPAGLRYYDGRIVPYKAYGDYFLTSTSFVFGDNGPFVMITVAAAVVMLSLYGTVRRFYGRTGGLLAALLFGFSFPTMFWAQSLYGNLPALALFSVGMWILSGLYVESGRPRLTGEASRPLPTILKVGWRPLLIGLLFGFAGVTRYEYGIFIAIFIVVLLLLDRRLWRVLATVSGTAGLIAIWPFLINTVIFGHPLRFPYTFVLPGRSTVEDAGLGESAGLAALFDRFFRHDVYPSFERLFTNWVDWVWGLVPVLVVLGLLGLWRVWKHQSPGRPIILAFTVAMSFWAYDTLGGFHWGEGTNFRGSVYGRYLLPLYYLLAILAAVSVMSFSSQVQGWLVTKGRAKFRQYVPAVLTGVIVSIAAANGFWLLFTGVGSLESDLNVKAQAKGIDAAVDQLPQDAIIVSNLYSKAIISRPVLDYYLGIPGTADEKRLETMRLMRRVLRDGYSVYILEVPRHSPSYIAVQNRILWPEDPRFEVEIVTIGGFRFVKIVESLWPTEVSAPLLGELQP